MEGGRYEEKHFQRNLVSTCTVSSRGTVGVCGVGSAWVPTTVQHVFPNFVSNCVLVLTASFSSILWWASHSSKKKWSWPSKYSQILSDISHSHLSWVSTTPFSWWSESFVKPSGIVHICFVGEDKARKRKNFSSFLMSMFSVLSGDKI